MFVENGFLTSRMKANIFAWRIKHRKRTCKMLCANQNITVGEVNVVFDIVVLEQE